MRGKDREDRRPGTACRMPLPVPVRGRWIRSPAAAVPFGRGSG